MRRASESTWPHKPPRPADRSAPWHNYCDVGPHLRTCSKLSLDLGPHLLLASQHIARFTACSNASLTHTDGV